MSYRVTLGSIDNPPMELTRVDGTAGNPKLWEGEIRAHESASGAGKAVVPMSREIDGLCSKSPVRRTTERTGITPRQEVRV